jgi:energy-coupling factor transporter ATP-binding protein EcfA2
MLNLILGVTGVGKSTLFNYLNGVPMVVVLGKNGKVVIDIEKGYNGSAVIAPIGHTFTS